MLFSIFFSVSICRAPVHFIILQSFNQPCSTTTTFMLHSLYLILFHSMTFNPVTPVSFCSIDPCPTTLLIPNPFSLPRRCHGRHLRRQRVQKVCRELQNPSGELAVRHSSHTMQTSPGVPREFEDGLLRRSAGKISWFSSVLFLIVVFITGLGRAIQLNYFYLCYCYYYCYY